MPIDYDGTNTSSQRTYCAATSTTLVCPAGTKSFFSMMGSATKLILINRIYVSGLTMTSPAYNNIVIRKISSVPSGGTSSSLTKVSLDTINPDSTANTCSVYTVEPTTDGTLVGTLQSKRVLINNTSAAAGDQQAVTQFDFNGDTNTDIILRGVNQGISLAFGTTPASAITLSLELCWLEIDN